jgi:hypothetical protein
MQKLAKWLEALLCLAREDFSGEMGTTMGTEVPVRGAGVRICRDPVPVGLALRRGFGKGYPQRDLRMHTVQAPERLQTSLGLVAVW